MYFFSSSPCFFLPLFIDYPPYKGYTIKRSLEIILTFLSAVVAHTDMFLRENNHYTVLKDKSSGLWVSFGADNIRDGRERWQIMKVRYVIVCTFLLSICAIQGCVVEHIVLLMHHVYFEADDNHLF